MTRINFYQRLILSLCFVFAVTAWSVAATPYPLRSPIGLTVDANGNLYVANATGGKSGQVLIYNANYVQQTAKTITQGINHPIGVAHDSQGRMYVSNYYGSNVTAYDTNLKQIPSATISGLVTPGGLAVDAMDDVWVVTDQLTVRMYSPEGTPLATSTPGPSVYSIAAHGRWYAFGTVEDVYLFPAGEVLTNAGIAGSYPTFSVTSVLATTFDAQGNLYLPSYDQTFGTYIVIEANPYVAGVKTVVSGLPDNPGGLAVDLARKRIYVADTSGNMVYVYSTSGVLLKTLK
jgi:sugar lactone lactonase YvrE